MTPNKVKFTKESLSGYEVLVIANAGAAQAASAERTRPAFTDEECDAVREWVRAGGALLLIADHAPAGPAAAILAARFDVDMSKGYTADPANYEHVTLDASWIRFSRRQKNLGDHPITRGRDASERINSVLTAGPPAGQPGWGAYLPASRSKDRKKALPCSRSPRRLTTWMIPATLRRQR